MWEPRVTQTCSALVLALLLSACSSSMTSQVTIEAPRERVWKVLADVEAYPDWNPFFVEAKGVLRVGESLEVTMQPVGKDRQSFSPTVLHVDPGRRLVWRGRLLLPWLFDGTHSFTIEPLDAGSVRFTQHEDFAGIFVPFVGFEPYRQGWQRMNAALKQRAEASAPRKSSMLLDRMFLAGPELPVSTLAGLTSGSQGRKLDKALGSTPLGESIGSYE